VPLRSLSDAGGPGIPEDQVRAYAKQFTVTDKETGEDREGLPTDNFPANTNAGAPDLSLMAKARAGFHGPYGTGINQLFRGMGGPEYIHAILTGYTGEEKEEFGTTGAIEGVAGPEAANNAAITATLIPLLTLGIPTSNTTAILLGAFQNYGIQPGPQLFQTNGALVWALIASMYIGNVMLLVLNLPLIGLWVKLLKVPKPYLYAGILVFATLGVYGMRQSAFDLVLLYAIGLLGVVMRRFDFPTAPVVVGMILGPLAEAQMRNAVAIGEGKWTIFLERPVSLALLLVVLAVLVLPRAVRRWAAMRPAQGVA